MCLLLHQCSGERFQVWWEDKKSSQADKVEEKGLSRIGWKLAAETGGDPGDQQALCAQVMKVLIFLRGNWTFGWTALQAWECQGRVMMAETHLWLGGAAPRCYYLTLHGYHNTCDPSTQQRDKAWSMICCYGNFLKGFQLAFVGVWRVLQIMFRSYPFSEKIKKENKRWQKRLSDTSKRTMICQINKQY